ncbi:L,D-transpeptidase domain-containing protein (plasmid) [Rhizobium sp. NXC24]|nr:L,D-transpeptidase domain-containing protein [Rhizobium sp. NXC24]
MLPRDRRHENDDDRALDGPRPDGRARQSWVGFFALMWSARFDTCVGIDRGHHAPEIKGRSNASADAVVEDESLRVGYPIAVGREGKQWYGSTRVVSKRMHPEWRPTASMRQKNPRLPAVVKAGPANPLGTRAIYLADGLLGIHGTNDPSSIGTNASSGCFRMYREDVEELYDLVQPGTRVIVRR